MSSVSRSFWMSTLAAASAKRSNTSGRTCLRRSLTVSPISRVPSLGLRSLPRKSIDPPSSACLSRSLSIGR